VLKESAIILSIWCKWKDSFKIAESWLFFLIIWDNAQFFFWKGRSFSIIPSIHLSLRNAKTPIIDGVWITKSLYFSDVWHLIIWLSYVVEDTVYLFIFRVLILAIHYLHGRIVGTGRLHSNLLFSNLVLRGLLIQSQQAFFEIIFKFFVIWFPIIWCHSN